MNFRRFLISLICQTSESHFFLVLAIFRPPSIFKKNRKREGPLMIAKKMTKSLILYNELRSTLSLANVQIRSEISSPTLGEVRVEI